MNENLQFIENWLKENANKIYEFSFNPPAQESQLTQLETLIGKPLPDDFKQLYRWHNGLNDNENFGSLFYGFDFLSLEKIIQEYQTSLEDKEFRENVVSFIDDFDKEINPSHFSEYPYWIKFTFDGSRSGFYLDLSPSEAGNYGQVIFVDLDYDVAILVANSISDLVVQTVKDMKANKYHLDKGALEDDNHYLEVDSDIDVLNWHTSERWKRD